MSLRWVCSTFLISSAINVFAEDRITIGAFEFPPIYQDGADKGLSGDIALAALKASGVEARLEFFPVARMVQNVAAGEIHCALGGKVLFENPEVASVVRIVAPLQYVSQVFFFDLRKYPDGVAFNQVDELGDYRIGALEASGIMNILRKSGTLVIHKNSSHQGLAQQLALGRIDLWATVDLTGMKYLRDNFPQEYRHYRYSQPFNRGDVSFVCSRRRDPDNVLGRRFEQGLRAIKSDNTYLTIMARYYGGKSLINPNTLPDDLAPRKRQ